MNKQEVKHIKLSDLVLWTEYDGNRRVILALIAKKLVRSDLKFSSLPEVDDEIPCNVCSREVAINNYTSSKNFEQTIAISYALGAMLRISHRRS